MPFVVVLLALIAVAATAAVVLTNRRLNSERRRAAAAELTATERADEVLRSESARELSERERLAAEQARQTTEEALQATQQDLQAAEQARLAAEEQARCAAAAATEAADAAEGRVRAAEQRAEETANGIDPQLLWALELARSERTWRLTVALGPDLDSIFADTADLLSAALHVEVDAAREEVGAIVEIDGDLPTGMTAAGSVLTLRAVQELLATVVRRSETVTVRIVGAGRDVLVTVDSVDEAGGQVSVLPLTLPASGQFEAIEGGIRIRGALAETPA